MSDNTSAKGLAREIAQTLKEEPKGKTSPFDTNATVKRIEGGTAWVQIPGGVDETPVQLTLNAKEGDAVQIRVAGGKAWITGNGTNPPTDDTRANEANEAAIYAQTIAENAEGSARRASLAAEVAEAKAQSASVAADEAWEKADDAETAAGQARTSAQTANTAANGALTSLSTVQDVIGMLNWAQENASYSLTQDTDIVPGKTYWTRSGAGTEADPYVWTPVTNPVKASLSTYYEITGVEEAMGDFINAHLALTEEGLWILPDGMDSASYRVLIATGGQDHVYKDAGTYIIDAAGNTVAKLGEVITLGIDDGSQSYMTLDYHSMQMIDKEGEPYFHISDLRDEEGYIESTYKANGGAEYSLEYTAISTDYKVYVDGVERTEGIAKYDTFFRLWSPTPTYPSVIIAKYPVGEDPKAFTIGKRYSGHKIGIYSYAEGYDVIASHQYAHAEGKSSMASGYISHAEGFNSVASEIAAHAEGSGTIAKGRCSHAQNLGTIAAKENQTVIGKYNEEDTESDPQKQKALIIGNGTDDDDRSNALTVDWGGNVWMAGTVTENNGTRDIDLTISEATIQKYVDLGMSLT